MDDEQSHLRRRSVLALLAASGLAAGARADTGSPTLVVAGPPDSNAAQWARELQPAMDAGLMAAGRLRLRYVGGRDGVTGTNQFDGRDLPDGDGALLFPGSAAMAWLAGDCRVHFDAAGFITLLASVSPGLLVMRGGYEAIPAGQPIRIACSSPLEPSVAGMMGLEVLGNTAIAVAPGPDPVARARAGLLDAAFLTGARVVERRRDFAACGFVPAFAVGRPRPDGTSGRDPLLPDVPTLAERLGAGPPRSAALVAAWHAVAAASTLEAGLALPPLSPAAAVARWRRACRTSAAMREIRAQVASRQMDLLAREEAALSMSALLADDAAKIALRRWLAERTGWRPA